MRLLLPTLLLLGMSFGISDTFAQSLNNINAQVNGDIVVITYDLEAPDANQKFNVQLYGSHDNYQSPLKYLTGDFGEDILPGKNKRIQWDARGELNSFNGDITFEVRATGVFPAIKFTNPTSGTTFKRGKTYNVQWTGETPSNAKIQLYKNGIVLQTIGEARETGNITWSIPADHALGGDYSLMLVDHNNREITSSGSFSVKRKIPLLLKVAPVVVVGAAVYLLLGDDGGGSGEENSNLPEPPGTPGE